MPKRRHGGTNRARIFFDLGCDEQAGHGYAPDVVFGQREGMVGAVENGAARGECRRGEFEQGRCVVEERGAVETMEAFVSGGHVGEGRRRAVGV